MNTVTRRVLLGAMAAAPAMAATCAAPATASASTVAWAAALAQLEQARSVWLQASAAYDRAGDVFFAYEPEISDQRGRGYIGDTAESYNARQAAFRQDLVDRQAVWRWASGYEAAEAAEVEASKEQADAERRVMETPAPDWAAVVYKIEMAIEVGMDLDDLRPVIVDLRRLGQEAQS